MATNDYTQNENASQIIAAATQRDGILCVIEREWRQMTGAEFDAFAGLGETIATTRATCPLDVEHKITFAIECLEHKREGILDARGHEALTAALATAHLPG